MACAASGTPTVEAKPVGRLGNVFGGLRGDGVAMDSAAYGRPLGTRHEMVPFPDNGRWKKM